MAVAAPRYLSLGDDQLSSMAAAGATLRAGLEAAFDVPRDQIVRFLQHLRDEHGYQQLMEIAGVDYPDKPERFEVVYCLLSLTRNHRVRVHVTANEDTPVPSVTGLWPVAGWLEREVYDMYGVIFSGNADLRRILTDYGFEGHPFRKDFPLTGYTELRYSEAEKRVVYEPVSLNQDFRNFDFLMPWEGPEYRLPGDEKAEAQAPGAPSGAAAPTGPTKVAPVAATAGKVGPPGMADQGGGKPADDVANAQAGKTVEEKSQSEVSKASDVPNPMPKREGKKADGGDATA